MAAVHCHILYFIKFMLKQLWVLVESSSQINNLNSICMLLVNHQLTIESHNDTTRGNVASRPTFSPKTKLRCEFNPNPESCLQYLIATRLRSPSTVLSANYLNKHQQLRLLILHHVQSKLTVSNMLPLNWNHF